MNTLVGTKTEMESPAWWNRNADEVEKDWQDGCWWVGWARVELPNGRVLVCEAQGTMEGRDLGPIECVADVEFE